MDILTILGLLVALIGILGGNAIEGGHLSSLMQATAFLIVIIGSLGATLVATPTSDFKSAL